MKSAQIKKAGRFIAPLLKTPQEGKVIGITSKGVFLLFGERIAFLTPDAHDNPFMLYVDDPAGLPEGLNLNTPARIIDDRIIIGDTDYDLASISAIVPDALPQVKNDTLKGKVSGQILSIFHSLNKPAHADSFIFVADALLHKTLPVDLGRQDICIAIRNLLKGRREKDLQTCETALKLIIGSGKGLTPSGDDFVAGYLLVLNCLLDRDARVDEFTLELNSTALELTRKHSTWISANMVEAAASRLVDERIGLAAKVLLNTCKLDPVTVARKLESFGNSSGIDAFSGMVAALVPG